MASSSEESVADSVDELPVEIIERVLSFLPVPELCRLRSVCKSWLELLSKPSFHDLYDLNPKRKHDGFLFLTRDLDWDSCSFVDEIFRRTVSFLDLDTQRWHSIDAGEYFLSISVFPAKLSAMNDGLICELSTVRGSEDDLALTISDPVAKTRTTLPAPPEIFCLRWNLPILLPAVDSPARSFKVFLVNNPGEFGILTLTRVHVFEPARNEWKALRNPPKEFEKAIAVSAVMVAQVLYIVFQRERKFVLLSYDLQNNAWTELRRMSFPRKPSFSRKLRHPQLVARGSRLFMNAWSDGTNLSCFEVWEVVVAQNVCCRTVVQFTIAQLYELFLENDCEFDIAYGVPCVDSRGGCNSVVLMSSLSGKLISYELQSKAVSVLPTNPLIQGCWEKRFPNDIFRGKNMNLSLRNLLSQADGVSVSPS